jgi:hypothetical protein
VRLITRHGNDLTRPFPFIALAVDKLPVRLCLIDGEAIVCDENGLAVFELIRGHRTVSGAVPCPSRLGILAKNCGRPEMARHQVRTYQAAVWCYEKALGYQERNRLELTSTNIGRLSSNE